MFPNMAENFKLEFQFTTCVYILYIHIVMACNIDVSRDKCKYPTIFGISKKWYYNSRYCYGNEQRKTIFVKWLYKFPISLGPTTSYCICIFMMHYLFNIIQMIKLVTFFKKKKSQIFYLLSIKETTHHPHIFTFDFNNITSKIILSGPLVFI